MQLSWRNVILINLLITIVLIIGALVIYNYILAPHQQQENLDTVNMYLRRLFTDYPYKT